MVRIKNRYLLVNILSPDAALDAPAAHKSPVPDSVQFHAPSPDSLTPQVLSRLIKEHVSILYGDYGLGLVLGSLKILYLSPATSTAIIKVARDHYRLVWAALSFITKIPDGGKGAKTCVMRVVRVSGTVKKAEEEAIRRARVAILKANGEEGVDGVMGILGAEEVHERVADERMGVDVDEEEEDEDMESEDGG